MTESEPVTIALDTETRGPQRLDCGHIVIPGEHVTGYAIWDERRICYACADDKQRALATERGVVGGYLSGDGTAIVTWTGGKLLTVTSERQSRRGAFGVLVMVSAVDATGRRWYGRGAGRGWCVTMRRCKASR